MTTQMPEVLILDGEQTYMAFCPPLPAQHASLRELSEQDMDDRLKKSRCEMEAGGQKDQVSLLASILGSSGCWRRYRGTWELQNEKLFLVHVEGRYELLGEGPILADWFTGVLRVPQGRILTYVHLGFASVHEKELHIHVERGRVTAQRTYNNRDNSFDERYLGVDNMPGDGKQFRGDSDFN